jgi:hypothetical protein
VSGSDLTTFTANGSRDGTGRGLGAQALHCSEVAYWPDAAGTLLSLRQTVADEPNTFVILESTANGIGDVLHEEWERAVSGESGYIALFFVVGVRRLQPAARPSARRADSGPRRSSACRRA